MKTTVTLESKDIRIMIARFLGIPLEQVMPLRYGFCVAGMREEEIAWKLHEGSGER